jgi:hypothetical protein
MSLRKPIVFETPFNQYNGTEVIGQGGAGLVYKAYTDDDNTYAIKRLDSTKATRLQGFTPLFVLAHLNVESLPLARGTEDNVHPVNAAVLGRPSYIASPNLGSGCGH